MTIADKATAQPALSPTAHRFLDAPRFAIVATLNPDGSPLQAVVWYGLEGDVVVFTSRAGRRWPTNLIRDPRVSLTIADGYDYVEIRGEVEIDEDPVLSQQINADLTHRYQRDPNVAAAWVASSEKERRMTLRLRPSSVFERLADH
ncbi:MAG TPA: TIGR03618 family F420-dependent PPOX class oxidoreductase [Candidatus Limnocylindrales bacterium]